MATCSNCTAEVSRWDLQFGLCAPCALAKKAEESSREALATAAAEQQRRDAGQAASRIILTTETAHNLPVIERLDIVTAEVVIGMHLFKDIGAMFRDTFGGRSKIMQQGLREARETALAELRLEAFNLGADAVVGVDLDYSEISGQGKSMLLLVASGTAVSLEKQAVRP
ncbi:YbjQ family protein [Pseudotabrizicola algicola]|uniref:UPF0145 protein G3572_15620 n=1 Tax=Pseudotabrizicola algicola TaxID=2709381 RepID=A0A6B3RQ69_9RHOB|nr:YbjQ family protein [Pseudotabrizicola algicola]NEX47641.1 heavy metal-binding domain-containing protein [Pseudotabrizicola algicola]